MEKDLEEREKALNLKSKDLSPYEKSLRQLVVEERDRVEEAFKKKRAPAIAIIRELLPTSWAR